MVKIFAKRIILGPVAASVDVVIGSGVVSVALSPINHLTNQPCEFRGISASARLGYSLG